MRVRLSWREWSGPNKARITITMGTLAIGSDKQPRIGKVTDVKTWTIRAHEEKSFVLQAPGPRFRLEVHVSPRFHPHDYDPANGDRREVGVVIKYSFVSSRRRGR
jgi:hypothetical protein